MPETILIVEDDLHIQELLEYNLKQDGFATFTTTRGDLVFELIKKQRPDLILLDLMMPGLNGIEVCKKLRSQDSTAKIPVIMVTAKGAETDKIVGLELGADDYITK